ncbi:MAG: Uma2 family endonuclease, partial [Vicinamibacterales bacterium]
IKRDLFDRGGVREYWVVDPKIEDVAVYRRDANGRLGPAGVLTAAAGSVLGTPLLPGLELPLAKLFA